MLMMAGAALTWYLDKSFSGVSGMINDKGEPMQKPKGNQYPDIGYERQLSKNIPWDVSRAKAISDWKTTNPLPFIDIQKGGENVRVTDNTRQPILPNQKQRFAKLVHQRENIEEYFRFDQYLGGGYLDQRPTERRSSIAYRYNF